MTDDIEPLIRVTGVKVLARYIVELTFEDGIWLVNVSATSAAA